MASRFSFFVMILCVLITVSSQQQTSNCTKSPRDRCDRQCGAILWNTCMKIAREISHSAQDLEQEADRNLPLRMALNFSQQNERKAENLVRNFSDIPVRLDEVFLLMAYTYDSPDNETVAFYRDINEDIRKHGLSGGRYPVAKYLLRDVLIRIGLERPLKRKLYRHEPAAEMNMYAVYSQAKMEITFGEFTSVSSRQDVYGCEGSYIRVEFEDYRAAVFMRPFSLYPQEQEVLFPPYYKAAFVRSFNEDKKSVVLSGPGTEQNFPECISAGTNIHISYVIYAVSVIMTSQWIGKN